MFLKNDSEFIVWYMFEQGMTYVWNILKFGENGNLLETDQIRRDGGGRYLTEVKMPDIDKIFLRIIDQHIAGDPMDENIKWVKISKSDICAQMKREGITVSVNIVRKLLKKYNFVKRKMQRKTKTGESKDRDQQFKIIEKKKQEFSSSKNPIISFDTKKKIEQAFFCKFKFYPKISPRYINNF